MGALKNLIIAVTGTMKHDNSQLRKWIEANDGRYSPSVRKGITHLIAGEDAWRNSSDAVQAATMLGVFVVDYDWLEDSLQKRRRLAEKAYTWEYKWQARKLRKMLKKLGPAADAKKFLEGCEEAKKATGTGTSKSRPRVAVRKPKQSKSFFFADVVNVPFVSAADDLKRRREEREGAKAKKAEEQAAKKTAQAETDRAVSSASSAAKFLSSEAENDASPPTSASSHTLSANSSPPALSVLGAQAKKPSLKDLYHYYLDSTGFEYKIVLTRCNLRANEITLYRLSILESHTKPHVYCTFVEYIPPGTRTTPSSGEACIQALLDFNATFHDDSGTGLEDTTSSHEDNYDCSPQTHHPLPQQQPTEPHPEATRLNSLLAPPLPSTAHPFKSLIAPMTSPFPTAWRAFRHAFRDLTLLTWEERFDVSKTLYKTRAAQLGIEPFVYTRPKAGLPLGLRVQEVGMGLFQDPPAPVLVRGERGEVVTAAAAAALAGARGVAGGVAGVGEVSEANTDTHDPTYTHNAFSLPSLTPPLTPTSGLIGSALHKEATTARRLYAEKTLLRAQEAEAARLKGLGLRKSEDRDKESGKGRGRRNLSRPLFNGVLGRPRVDAWARWKGEGEGKYGRPFPSERRGF